MTSPGEPNLEILDTTTGQIDPSAMMNKAEWHQMLDVRVTAAAQTGNPLSVLFVDVNHFKDVNDTLGHEAGDLVIADIRKMVTALAGSLRTRDENGTRVQDLMTIAPAKMPELDDEVAANLDPGHIGGDEFAILCGTDEAGADAIAQRLRDLFDDYLMQPESHRLKALGIGLAIGAATLKEDMSASELLAKADLAMYENKFKQLPRLNERQRIAIRLTKFTLKAAGIRLRDAPKYWQHYLKED